MGKIRNLKTYTSIFRTRLIGGLQYRAAAWAGVATQFFWGLMHIMVYRAFYMSSTVEPSMPWEHLVSYIWLQQAFLAIIMLWWQDTELLSGISSGQVAYELCRPYRLYPFWFARLLAQRLSNVALRCLPVLVFAFIVPAPYRMSLPASVSSCALFFLSLSLSLFLVTAVSMFIYILTFVTLSPVGSRLIIGVAAEFLQGSIIPIPLMPGWLQSMLNFLPFRYAADLPFRLYSGAISGGGALFQIGIQTAWIAGLIIVGLLSFKKITRKIVIQGG